MWVDGRDNEEIDAHVHDDCSTPYQVVQVVAAETNQPEREQSENDTDSDAYEPTVQRTNIHVILLCSPSYSRENIESKTFYSNILPVPEHAVEYKACHCKGNACSSQNGEDDSEGKMY